MKFEEKWESEWKEEEGAETWPSCFAGGQYVPSYKQAGIVSVVPVGGKGLSPTRPWP